MKKKDLQQLYSIARKAIGVSWLVIFGVVETVNSAPPPLERPAAVTQPCFSWRPGF